MDGKRITSLIRGISSNQHNKPIDADSNTTGRRHSITKRIYKVIIMHLGFLIPKAALLFLGLKPLHLVQGIIQF